jgi:hypothetical protein
MLPSVLEPRASVRAENRAAPDCSSSWEGRGSEHTWGYDGRTCHRNNSRMGRNAVHGRWRLVRAQNIQLQLPRP